MFIVVHFIFMMFTSKFKFYTKTKPIRIPEELTDSILYDKDIFITPGTVFGSQGEGYIRFSLCVTSEIIKEAIGRV